MDFITTARKKTERWVEKGFMDVSDAIYATGSAVGKGGSKITSVLTSSVGAVGNFGSEVYDQAWNLVGVTKTANVQEKLEANE